VKNAAFSSRTSAGYPGEDSQMDDGGFKKSSYLDAESIGTSSMIVSSPYSKGPSAFDFSTTHAVADSFSIDSTRNAPMGRNTKSGLHGISNSHGPKAVAVGLKAPAGSSSLMHPPVGLVGDYKPMKPRADLVGTTTPILHAPVNQSELPSSRNNMASKSVELASMSDADIEELRSSPDQKGTNANDIAKTNFTGFASLHSATSNDPQLSRTMTASGSQYNSPSRGATAIAQANAASVEDSLVAGNDTDDEYIQWLNAQVAGADAPANALLESASTSFNPSSPVSKGSNASQEPSAANPASLLSPLPMVKHPRDIARRPEQVPASPADELSPLSKIMGQIKDSSSKYNPWLHRHADPAVAELIS
jgi:hypothetical protein